MYIVVSANINLCRIHCTLVLLWCQDLATWSVAVVFWTHHHGGSGSGGGLQCSLR